MRVVRLVWLRCAGLSLTLAAATVAADAGAGVSLPGARPAVQANGLDEVRRQEREAAAALEQSSKEVRAAGIELARVASALPGAEQEAARARGALAGATAKSRAATARADEAERALTEARAEVERASAEVAAGRREIGALARRAYQRGRLDGMQSVFDARDPQQALRRSGMLRSVFRHRSTRLDRLTDDRLELASKRASLAAEERAAAKAHEQAAEEQVRAERLAAAAEDSARRVAALVEDRRAALATAERLREQDRRDYVRAQAESRALAERIRAAAAKAAAERAAAQAAAEAARRRAAATAPEAPRAPSRPSRGRSAGWLWPAEGRLTSGYGYRRHPIYNDRRMHTGIDIGAGTGVPIVAAEDGTVLFSSYSGGYGKLTVVEHDSRNGRSVTTSYAHQSVSYVRDGQRVRRGQMIGRAGSTGNVTGPHLHFEVRLDGDPVDPLDYVDRP